MDKMLVLDVGAMSLGDALGEPSPSLREAMYPPIRPEKQGFLYLFLPPVSNKLFILYVAKPV
jgi:hypothetical protein